MRLSMYKGYDPKVHNKATKKYVKEKQKSILLRWKKSEYEANIFPFIEASGLPVSTYIKQAVKEKIERENS